MNEINNIITYIYNNMIGIVLRGFESTYVNIVSKKYMDILINRYSDIQFDIKNINDVCKDLFELEYDEWNAMPIDVKKHILVDDLALEKIIDLSSEALKYAKNKLYNNIVVSKDVTDEIILKLNLCYNNVADFNKDLAMWYISESTVDLDYASGQSENTSMRIGHLRK